MDACNKRQRTEPALQIASEQQLIDEWLSNKYVLMRESLITASLDYMKTKFKGQIIPMTWLEDLRKLIYMKLDRDKEDDKRHEKDSDKEQDKDREEQKKIQMKHDEMVERLYGHIQVVKQKYDTWRWSRPKVTIQKPIPTAYNTMYEVLSFTDDNGVLRIGGNILYLSQKLKSIGAIPCHNGEWILKDSPCNRRLCIILRMHQLFLTEKPYTISIGGFFQVHVYNVRARAELMRLGFQPPNPCTHVMQREVGKDQEKEVQYSVKCTLDSIMSHDATMIELLMER